MTVEILIGDCLDVLGGLSAGSVHCCVTSPPYWGLRDYGVEGQLGQEKTPDEYVAKLVAVFREVWRVLRDDGTLWLVLGDSYAGGGNGGGEGLQRSNVGSLIGRKTPPKGFKSKDLIGIPWMAAFALRADGWYLRKDIIWDKPNGMPSSATDRPTNSHEYVFLMSKSARYYYDHEAIAEPLSSDPKTWGRHSKKDPGAQAVCARPMFRDGRTEWGNGKTRNKRSVWTVATVPFSEAHFATYPPKLIEPCILAGCPKGGTVLDPFGGSGTTGLVADELGRSAVLIDLNLEYVEMAKRRIEIASWRTQDMFVGGYGEKAL